MSKEEQLEVIKNTNKSILARKLGITRQALYSRIKNNKKLDEVYKCAINCMNDIEEESKIEKLRQQIENLKQEKEELQEKIVDLDSKIQKLIKENNKLKLLTEEPIEQKNKYTDLLKRYNNQSKELLTYYTKYGKEGLNDNKRNRK